MIISISYGNDTILMGEGITKKDIYFSGSAASYDLIVKFKNNNSDQITIKNYNTAFNKIETILFSDGSKLDLTSATNFRLSFFGDAGNNSIGATEMNDEIFAGAGDDVVSSYEGNDVLNGEVGFDILSGGAGDDTYIFNNGDGLKLLSEYTSNFIYGKYQNIYQTGVIAYKEYATLPRDDNNFLGNDTIEFGLSITENDLTYFINNNDLHITIKDSANDLIIIKDHFTNANKIENLKFKTQKTDELGNLLFDELGNAVIEEKIVNLSNKDWSKEILRTNGTNANDVINGSNFSNQIINGGLGNDIISGSSANNILNGEEGDDEINGGNGSEIINGGVGNDNLYGFGGDDVYIYNLGDGNDLISDFNGNDTIFFGEGISKNDISISKIGNNLVITIFNNQNLTSNQITLQHFFSNVYYSYRIENLKFTTKNSDGSFSYETLSLNNFVKLSFEGTNNADYITASEYSDLIKTYSGNDVINSDSGNDVIDAGDGNDTINTGSGDDIVIGGKGDDIINDSNGGDETYIFNLGDGKDVITEYNGNDKILFGQGITKNDVYLSKSNLYDLVISFRNSANDKITIKDQLANYYYLNSNKIETLAFADGSVIDISSNSLLSFEYNNSNSTNNENINDINFASGNNDIIKTGSGNDTIRTGYGNDIIESGAGNDVISGGFGDDIISAGSGDDIIGQYEPGNDIYIYNLGDGKDIITESKNYSEASPAFFGNDKIKFGSGITKEMIYFEKTDNSSSAGNLVIKFKNNNADQITIENHFNHAIYRIETLEFADGSTIDLTNFAVLEFYYQGTENSEEIYGSDYNDIINANDGNDYINGSNGNDIIIGGKGDDFIGYRSNNFGNDTYIFNLGDGSDVIRENASSSSSVPDLGSDKIKFGVGISRSDILFTKVANNLEITFKNSANDKIQIRDFFAYQQSVVETIEFADGQILDISQINQSNINDFNALYYNTAPVISNYKIVANKVQPIVIKISDILSSAFDTQDGNSIKNIKISDVTFPDFIGLQKKFNKDGSYYYETSKAKIIINQSNNLITYQPNSNYYSDNKISYQIKDSNGALSNIAVIDIEIKDSKKPSQEIINKFDSDFYLSFYGDVRKAIEDGKYRGTALQHFINHGYKEGRFYSLEKFAEIKFPNSKEEFLVLSNNFDENFYLSKYLDVKNAILKGSYKGTAFQHFINNGFKEGRLSSDDYNKVIKGTANNDNLNGSIQNDIIRGNQGNDIITGKQGSDLLTGNQGNDVFKYVSLNDSTINSSDLITDFTKGEDKIDLSALDFLTILEASESNSNISNNNLLTYHYDQTTNQTIVENQANNFQIKLIGEVKLEESDFNF